MTVLPRPVSLREIVSLVSGRLIGNPDFKVSRIAPLEKAQEQDLTLVDTALMSERMKQSKASAYLVPEDISEMKENLIQVASPKLALAQILNQFFPVRHPFSGVSSKAVVHESVTLGRNVNIGAFAVIERGVTLGDKVTVYPGSYVGEGSILEEGVVLYPHVTLYPAVHLARHTVIHAGAVIGADGFGYHFDGKRHIKVPQVGTVFIDSDVEIGSLVAIDRATLSETRIGQGTKIDNLVQIGHNVSVGEHCIVCGQVGIAGGSQIGHGVILAGQVGLGDNCIIEDGAKLGPKTGVMSRDRIQKGEAVLGAPHQPYREFLKSAAVFQKLPELAKKVEQLFKKVNDQ